MTAESTPVRRWRYGPPARAMSAARGLAGRVTHCAGDDHDQQIETLFELALRRTATVEEQAEWCEFLAACSLVELCRAILNLNEFADID